MKRIKTLLSLGATALLFALGQPQARAYTHPCIPTTAEELATIKANLDQQPWKYGYELLSKDGKSQLSYVMNGPYTTVTRSPNLNLAGWSNDMAAVYNLARMWYFTGNNAYAQKARDILIAYANTQTEMGGSEAGLALGDLAMAYGGGASILRGTWPGWTAADTTAVKDLFLNVYWPKTAAGWTLQGPANKGSLNMMAGMAIALFCDDTAKFNHVLDVYRTYPGSGLPNTLPTGQMGETGRDAGHAYGDLLGKAFLAECVWKQGIDLFSEWDNRLLAVGEYYCRNTFEGDNPFVDYGTVDFLYTANAAGPYGANRAALYILQNAYKNRKGLPTPWIDRKLLEQPIDNYNFMFTKPADFSTATPPAAAVRPPVSLASSGLTLTTLGGQTSGRSLVYSNGTWTMTGLGSGTWTTGADDCQFAYQQMSGDCAIIAKVTSATYSGSNNGKVGVMIRDNLVGTVSQRAWAGMVPAPTRLLESHQAGMTEKWAGRVSQSYSMPSPGIPYWVKAERRGNVITTYSSVDGTSWSPTVCCVFGNLPATTYIGLFVCSGNTTATTATFENVAFTGGSGGLVTTPAAPAKLLASGSHQAITLRWLASFGATAYDVLRSTTSGGGYTVIAGNLTADKTSYADTTAAAGTTYYYVVRAKNSAGTSGNSPQFHGSLLPAPMVNLAFGGTATASFNQDSVNEGARRAFDTDAWNKWYGYNSPAGWLQYDFGAGNAQVIKRYSVSSSDVATRDPKDWTFLGSQDGSAWTTLDTQSGQAFANRMQMNTYNLGNTTAYRYYRLNITGNNGAGGTALSELSLWGDTGRTLPDGRHAIASRNSNKVVTALNGGTANGTQLVQWAYAGGNEQKWTLSHLGNGQYQVTGLASGRVMDVGGGSGGNGAKIQLWEWLGGNSQKWTVTPSGDGYFKMTAVHSGKVADIEGVSTADGAKVHQWGYVGGANQQWIIAPLSMTGITRLQSHNFPTRHLRHYGFRGKIDENVAPVGDSEFRVRIGLSSAVDVSFESANFAGYYLRVRANGEVWVDKDDGTAAFRDSATFVRVPGLADASKSSFRMWTDSTRYLRHSGYWLYAQSGSGSAFNGDATFAEVAQ